MLDVLCRQEPSFLYRTLSSLKALHARLCADPACVRALLPIAQFFLNHGEPGGHTATCSHSQGGFALPRLPSLCRRVAFL